MARSDQLRLIRGDHLAKSITPKELIQDRRRLLKGSAAVGALGLSSLSSISGLAGVAAGFFPHVAAASTKQTQKGRPIAATPSRYSILDKPVSFEDATTYNNFYEFGLEKDDPAAHAPSRLKTAPWKISVEGLVAKPRVWDIEELFKIAPMEERIYRLRCVEGWSMVIPWVGYSFSEFVKRAQPLGSAKYVEFTTLADPQQMPGLRSKVIRWPYHEGLRLDEANHPLTLLTFGMYGQTLPAQNGAPIRLMVPWKYGFKSIKSVVKIRFLESQPTTSWSLSAPHEYGFYSNVNPDVAHPRWSQASERVLGGGALFAPRRKTELFNGYADLVGSMYAGMDLKRFY